LALDLKDVLVLLHSEFFPDFLSTIIRTYRFVLPRIRTAGIAPRAFKAAGAMSLLQERAPGLNQPQMLQGRVHSRLAFRETEAMP
jgi:hypothetical protein